MSNHSDHQSASLPITSHQHIRWKEVLYAAGIYLFIALIVTFPLILSPTDTMFSGQDDQIYYLWMSWWRKTSFLEGHDFYFFKSFQAPFGTDNAFRMPPILVSLMAILSLPFGEVFGQNTLLISAFVLSGTLTFILARRFIANPWVAGVAGIVFAFSPYMMTHSRIHISLPQQWLIPMFILALFNTRQKKTLGSGIWLGIAFGVTFLTIPYYGYYVAIAALVFAAVEMVFVIRSLGWAALPRQRQFWLYGLGALVGTLICLPDLLEIRQFMVEAYAENPLRQGTPLLRDATQLFWYSTRPWDFLLPPVRHPVLGGFSTAVYNFLGNLERFDFTSPRMSTLYPKLDTWWVWGGTAREVYLGFTNIALATVAVREMWLRRKQPPTNDNAPAIETFTFTFFAVLFVVAILFSGPPYFPLGSLLRRFAPALHNLDIPLPALITAKIASPFRVSNRWAVVFMLSLGMLAAWGVSILWAHPRFARHRTRWFILIVCLIGFEFAQLPTVSSVAPPPEVEWLAELPEGTIVANMPFASRWNINFQRIHQHPIIDGMAFDANLNFDEIFNIELYTLTTFDAPDMVGKLAALGATHLYNAGPAPQPLPDGLELAFESDSGQVYTITAEPLRLFVLHTLRDGLWRSTADWGWQADEAAIYIWNPLYKPVTLDIAIQLSPGSSPAEMQLTRHLTPPPEFIIIGSAIAPNPNIPPAYSEQPLTSVSDGEQLTFQAVTIQPGESLLQLTWATPADHPDVLDVSIVLPPDVLEK